MQYPPFRPVILRPDSFRNEFTESHQVYMSRYGDTAPAVSYCLFLYFVTVAAVADGADTAPGSPPRLLTDPLIRATPELVKRGLWGSGSVTADVDSAGSVTSCTVAPTENSGFDSLVKHCVAGARFAPAIESGQTVASLVTLRIAVPLDSLVAQCRIRPPAFAGSIIDSLTGVALPKSRLRLLFTDTTEDTTLTIGFSRFLSLVGNSDGSTFDGTILTTFTDSLGQFACPLLPRGHFVAAIQSPGYEPGRFYGAITGSDPLRCRYGLVPLPEPLFDTGMSIVVYGRPAIAAERMTIDEEERQTGFSALLSNIVQAKPEIRRVPEGPSMMLVRSGCPFDNVYRIAGIPMLAPFHFGGHPYADIDGVMISALSKVNVLINTVAAKKVDASGCIVEADPGRIVYDNGCDVKGLYIKGDFGMRGVDILAAYAARKKPGDFLQIGYSISDDYMLKCENNSYRSVALGNQGIGIPLKYGNATLSGSKSAGKLRYDAFGWFAWDSYNPDKVFSAEKRYLRDSLVFFDRGEKAFLPWGMGSIKISSDTTHRSLTIGGAHQFFGTGRQIVSRVYTTRACLDNSEFVADFDTIIRTPFTATATARITGERWQGSLAQQEGDAIDTFSRAYGLETGAHLTTSLGKRIGRFFTGLDLLGAVISYGDERQPIGDAGVSASYETDDVHFGIHAGRITSRPDIRGLPDPLFRKQLNYTYIGSLPFFVRHGILTKLGIEPYVRYSTKAPQLDPVTRVWNPGGSSPVTACGADLQFRLTPAEWIDLSASVNLAQAKRTTAAGDSIAYEWSLPWTVRSHLHLRTINDRFHLLVDYIHTKGLPYYDITSLAYEALPIYRSLDLNFQIRTYMPQQPHINRLDCFFTVKNAMDLLSVSNIRDYYWDEQGNRQPVFLGLARADIGARFGIRW